MQQSLHGATNILTAQQMNQVYSSNGSAHAKKQLTMEQKHKLYEIIKKSKDGGKRTRKYEELASE
jgi:hypothetical protein